MLGNRFGKQCGDECEQYYECRILQCARCFLITVDRNKHVHAYNRFIDVVGVGAGECLRIVAVYGIEFPVSAEFAVIDSALRGEYHALERG